MQAARQEPAAHPLERVAAVLAAILCVSLFIILWRSLSPYQPVWPLPGLYFVEMVILAVLGAYVFMRGHTRLTAMSWGAAGAILAFCILGAWSVGFFYLPAALLLGIASLISDLRNRQPLAAHLGVFLLAGLAEAALILAAARSGPIPEGPQTAPALRVTDTARVTPGIEPAPSATAKPGSDLLPRPRDLPIEQHQAEVAATQRLSSILHLPLFTFHPLNISSPTLRPLRPQR